MDKNKLEFLNNLRDSCKEKLLSQLDTLTHGTARLTKRIESGNRVGIGGAFQNVWEINMLIGQFNSLSEAVEIFKAESTNEET